MAENKQPAGEPSTLSAPSAPATGTATVAVALKHPHGIVMQGYQMVKSGEVTPQGYREVEIAQPVDGARFTLRGNSFAVSDLLAGRYPSQIVGGAYGYAITDGVPLDLYREWWRANARAPLVVNRLVGPPPEEVGDAAKAAAWATAQGLTRSGLEPLDPLNPAIPGIQRGDRGDGPRPV